MMPGKKEDEKKEDKQEGISLRDAAKDEAELDRARDWRARITEPVAGTRAWRTDHTEITIVLEGNTEAECFLRVTDITTGRHVQAPLTADDLDILAHILELHASRLRKVMERR